MSLGRSSLKIDSPFREGLPESIIEVKGSSIESAVEKTSESSEKIEPTGKKKKKKPKNIVLAEIPVRKPKKKKEEEERVPEPEQFESGISTGESFGLVIKIDRKRTRLNSSHS